MKLLEDALALFSLGDAIQFFQSWKKGASDGKKSDGKPSADSETSDKNLPTNLFTEKFTQVDNSYWEYLLSLLPLEVETTIRKITDRMSERDKAKETTGDRVNSFRIGTLLMPNKITEEVIEKTVPQQGQGGKGGGTKKETTTRKSDTRFDPDKDSRIKYLVRLHKSVEQLVASGKEEDAAINTVIDRLEQSGFLSTDSLKKKVKELFGEGKELAEKLSTEAYLAVLHHRLSWKETRGNGSVIRYDRYKEIVAGNPGTAEADLIPKFLDAIEARNQEKRIILKKERDSFLPDWAKVPLRAIGAMLVIIVIIGIARAVLGH